MRSESEIRRELRLIIAKLSRKITAEQLTDQTLLLEGGIISSLKLMELVVQIERLSGIEVDTATVSEASFRNIDSIYEAFFRSAETAQSHPKPDTASQPGAAKTRMAKLVALKATGSKRPVICLPGAGGYTFTYNGLASLIDKDRPVYALESLDRETGERLSFAQLVQGHIRAIESKFQPPYHLYGLSLGAAFAFEVALLMQRNHRAVASLTLVAPVMVAPRRYARFARPVFDSFEWFVVHAPKLGRMMPGVGTLFRVPTRVGRAMWALRENPTSEHMIALMRHATPGVFPVDDAELRMKPPIELWAMVLEHLRKVENGVEKLLMPGVSAEVALANMLLFKQHIRHTVTFRPTGTYNGVVNVVDELGNRVPAASYQPFVSQPIAVRYYAMKDVWDEDDKNAPNYTIASTLAKSAGDNVGAHFAAMNAANVRLYVKDLDRIFDEADAC